ETTLDHVAVGATVRLRIGATASITGDAVPAADELTVSLRDRTTGFRRVERFFHTSGRFALHDLPPGRFDVALSCEHGKKQLVIELAEGEHQQLHVAIEPFVALIGRVVDPSSRAPIRGIAMAVEFDNTFDYSNQEVTDTDGRFRITNVPRGTITIAGLPGDEWASIQAVRTIHGSGTIDIGVIEAVHR